MCIRDRAGLRDFETVELYPLTFDTDFIPLAEVRYQPQPIDEARLWACLLYTSRCV